MNILQLKSALINNGYQYVEGIQPKELNVYYQDLIDKALVILVLNLDKNINLNGENFRKLQKNIKGIFQTEKEIQLFSVIFTNEVERVYDNLCDCQNYWIYDIQNDKTIIFENQPDNFYGLYDLLENNYNMENIYEVEKREIHKYKKPIVTMALMMINIIVFVLLEIMGSSEDSSFMARYGALFVPYVLEGNQYYRFITSMFMHFGINHLFNNMIMLFCIGEILEKQIGRISFLSVYILSGIGANLISFFYYLKTDELVVSAGASGAIFGILGSLLVVVVMNKGKLESITTMRLIFMICLSLYLGYIDINTNNAAHIGGLFFGIVLGIVLSRITVFNREKK